MCYVLLYQKLIMKSYGAVMANISCIRIQMPSKLKMFEARSTNTTTMIHHLHRKIFIRYHNNIIQASLSVSNVTILYLFCCWKFFKILAAHIWPLQIHVYAICWLHCFLNIPIHKHKSLRYQAFQFENWYLYKMILTVKGGIRRLRCVTVVAVNCQYLQSIIYHTRL